MSENLVDATTQILDAIRQAEVITAAGSQSLAAIAARAVDPDVRLSRQAIGGAFGLHDSIVIAITVASDRAGDTESRRAFGLGLFERLQLHTHQPRLTRQGQLLLAVWCLERLTSMAELLGGDLLGRSLELARAVAQDGSTPGRGHLLELQEAAEALQRAEVVGITKGETRERLGVSDEQRFQIHTGQALRALLQGLIEPDGAGQATITVAGEVTQALDAGLGFAAAAGFTLELAQFIDEELPRQHLDRPPEN